MHARIRGCLLDDAVGDALGAPVEFLSLSAIKARFGPQGIADFTASVRMAVNHDGDSDTTVLLVG